jgi:hypothetical protein
MHIDGIAQYEQKLSIGVMLFISLPCIYGFATLGIMSYAASECTPQFLAIIAHGQQLLQASFAYVI